MALVKGGRYYQQSIRVNGQVTTRYFGKNGVMFALWDEEIREEKQEERDRLKSFEAQEDKAYREARDRGKRASMLVSMALNGLGFIRWRRNAWRRTSMAILPAKCSSIDAASIRQRMRKLVERIDDNDSAAIGELRTLSHQYPQEFAAEVEMDVVRMSLFALVMHELPGDEPHAQKLQEDWRARIELMARELAGDGASMARKLCAQAAAVCHAEHWLVTMSAANAGMRTEPHPKTIRKRNAAFKRYMVSLRVLAQIIAAEQRPRRMTFSVKPGESIFAGLSSMADMLGTSGG